MISAIGITNASTVTSPIIADDKSILLLFNCKKMIYTSVNILPKYKFHGYVGAYTNLLTENGLDLPEIAERVDDVRYG